MALGSATVQFSPANGVIPRPTATSRPAGAVRFFPGNGGRQGAMKLRLCRSASADDRRGTLQLLPEDLIEPTGYGEEELEAIRDALIRDPLQPIWLALQEIVATGGNLFRCRCFHAGIVFGSLLLVAGLCQLYKLAPNLFMDLVLGYMFYKLSVLAADLKRSGKANAVCARIQWVLIIILSFKFKILFFKSPIKDFYYHFTTFIWEQAYDVYMLTVLAECLGIKNPRQMWEADFKKVMKTIGDWMVAESDFTTDVCWLYSSASNQLKDFTTDMCLLYSSASNQLKQWRRALNIGTNSDQQLDS